LRIDKAICLIFAKTSTQCLAGALRLRASDTGVSGFNHAPCSRSFIMKKSLIIASVLAMFASLSFAEAPAAPAAESASVAAPAKHKHKHHHKGHKKHHAASGASAASK
jgi:hypothetical protein